MRKPIIAGNWKMNKTIKEAGELFAGLKERLNDIQDVEIVVCPPFTALMSIANMIKDSKIQLGAQDVFWQESGAYTGEVSCTMLNDLGCRYVIIGHSERRTYFAETNDSVNKKVQAALENDLTPIMCVGEKLEEREKGKTFAVIEDHVRAGLKDINSKLAKRIVIAYEPVWAIGTGKTATAEQAQEAHNFIRNLVRQMYQEKTADLIRIQYGGSVKPENISELMKEDDIDGALVGGASLKIDSFASIVRGAKGLKN